MICDAILFYNENLVFEVRYNELKDVVDKFYVFECNMTFNLKDKPYNFQHSGLPKVEYVKVPKEWIMGHLPSPNRPQPRQVEVLHRLFAHEFLNKALKPEDLLVFGDADEIPRALVVRLVADSGRAFCLETSLYRYAFNLYFQDWKHMFAGSWGVLNKIDSLELIRTKHSHSFPKVVDAGWHFNNIGSPEDVLQKLGSCGQYTARLATTNIRLNKENVAKLMSERRAISVSSSENRLRTGQVRPLTEMPKYIQEHPDKFSYFLIKE